MFKILGTELSQGPGNDLCMVQSYGQYATAKPAASFSKKHLFDECRTYEKFLNTGNAVPMRPESFLTMEISFLPVPLEMAIVIPVTFLPYKTRQICMNPKGALGQGWGSDMGPTAQYLDNR